LRNSDSKLNFPIIAYSEVIDPTLHDSFCSGAVDLAIDRTKTETDPISADENSASISKANAENGDTIKIHKRIIRIRDTIASLIF
jgi:hypothetical protein